VGEPVVCIIWAVWLGLNQQSDGTWVWSSGQPATYTSWATGQPYNYGSYTKAYLNSDGQWYSYVDWEDCRG